ncbi:MAG: hypothetical protein NTW32_17260 [Chloroflexi bacterium]|nr:hypothetical protein [Chloroflexota bacterium]
MQQLSKRERVDAALKGEDLDRVPVSAWQHFIPAETQPETLAAASLQYFHTYDWDWLKVNPRATYYAEAWGNRYDYRNYTHVYPRLLDGPLHSPADLDKIEAVSPTSGVFAGQLELLRQIKAGMGGAHFLQTLFSPLSVLGFLVGRPATHSTEAVVQSQYDGLRQYIAENPQGVHNALQQITSTLSAYASAVLESGASGLFFAITKLAREGILSQAEFSEFGKPYDLQLLRAVQSAPFNLLHICGARVYFDAVLDYPVHAINWAASAQQNPQIAEAGQRTNLALVGGVDEHGALQIGSPGQVIEEARGALRTSGRRFLLTPGCATNMLVPPANLHALRQAVEPL